MSGVLSHGGLSGISSRGELLDLIERTGAGFGLKGNRLRVLRYCIRLIRDPDDLQPDRICAVWAKTETIARDLDVDPRVVRRAVEELERAGFLIRTSGRFQPRCGKRTAGNEGPILRAFGLNLQPLIDHKVPELLEALAQKDQDRRAACALRERLKDLWTQVKQIGAPGLLLDALEIIPQGRISRILKLDGLRDAIERLKRLLSTFAGRTETPAGADKTVRPNTNPESNSKTCSAEAGQKHQAVTAGDVLEAASPEFRDFAECQDRPGWPAIIETASLFLSSLGIDRLHWAEACHRLGRKQAACLITIIDRNAKRESGDRYALRARPEAAFRGLVAASAMGRESAVRMLRKNLARGAA